MLGRWVTSLFTIYVRLEICDGYCVCLVVLIAHSMIVRIIFETQFIIDSLVLVCTRCFGTISSVYMMVRMFDSSDYGVCFVVKHVVLQ